MAHYRLNPDDIALLRKEGMNEAALEHSVKVAEKALQ